MSLRWRIALAMAAIAAATTISVGIASYRATSTRLLEEVDSSLVAAWQKIDDNPTYNSNAELLAVYMVQIVGPRGNVRPLYGGAAIPAGNGPEQAWGDPGTLYHEVEDVGDSHVRVVTGVPRTAGWPNVVLQVGRSLDENERVLHDLKTRTMVLVVVVTAAAAVLGWLIAMSVSGPLARLTRAATQVQRSGRLDVEVPVSGTDEVGRLGAAFNGMLGALAVSRDDQRRLVEDAGHELRTPLTSVRTNLAVLRRHPDLDPATRAKIVDDLNAETEELVVLVEEVVALARGATDDAVPEPVELGPLARAIAQRAERRHDRPVVVTADASVVEAPPPALERAISNLVDNAAKFDTGGGPIEIEIAAGRLLVRDRGPGIADADVGRVFDRFYRAEGARSQPGSGLGLSIVRDVVERAGGRVEVARRPGGGAVVGFVLPLVPVDPANGDPRTPPAPTPPGSGAPDAGGSADGDANASWSPPLGVTRHGPPV